ncbi:MAG: dienelactone hydrolase family protein [Solirubrobacterales bacterium]|nr:dienelactone hydrolase family protein [Solirubrobacterales bacterium]MBV8943962.1 dienelactone hydrolase family protein [Solirubrobacterales bacterium]MBV9684472.1 dienelactone hydrolase family protein [Solirubrobacterales bacterium]
MARTVRVERVQTSDGVMDAHVSLPESGAGPGIVVIQEIYGVGDYIKESVDRLAGLGYVALAPDLYWRIEPGIALEHDEAGLAKAFETVQKLDQELAVRDSIDALKALRELPEVTDRRAGVLGFCLGGTLAFGVAIQADPDVAVCYYGSGIAGALERADAISCPVLFHFGGQDQFIPREQIDRVCTFAESRPDMECHIQEDAGHAFDNHEAPMFHQPGAAARAWEITREFLARTLPA